MMKKLISPLGMIIVGVILMLMGVIFPFLIVTKVLVSTFFLNFFSFTASLAGLFMGIIGIAMYSRGKKDPYE